MRYNGYARHTVTWIYIALITLMGLTLNTKLQAQVQAVMQPQVQANTMSNNTLQHIDFVRGKDNAAVLTLTFATPITNINVLSKDTFTELQLLSTQVPSEQLAEYDVSQFGLAVTHIETFTEQGNARIRVTHSQAQVLHKAQLANQWIFTFSSRNAHPPSSPDRSQYTGKPISLDFQDVPVRQVLQIIAQLNDFNLVTTDTVIGNVTINLQRVPWDQALAMILNIRGLDKRIEGNILLIAPQEELTARETATLNAQQQVQNLVPLVSENIVVNYAKAEHIAHILQSRNGGILSIRGSVAVDERTNTLLIRDTFASIVQVKHMLSELDVPVRQVLIESRMVTVRDNLDEQLGVRWGITERRANMGLSGSATAASNLNTGVIPDLSDRLNVNLPVANAAGSVGIQIANLVDGTILDLELSAMEAENKGEIIASPRITVANQQEAYIEQGTEIPYVQSTASGATSVAFKKAVLSLKVTPHITPDNSIILDLVVTQDTRGETVSTSTGPAVAIDTQEIKTQVLVENGETIVLGGIFQQISTDDVSKVPILGDLPMIGGLFRNTVSIEQKRELLIFVTPKIVMD